MTFCPPWSFPVLILTDVGVSLSKPLIAPSALEVCETSADIGHVVTTLAVTNRMFSTGDLRPLIAVTPSDVVHPRPTAARCRYSLSATLKSPTLVFRILISSTFFLLGGNLGFSFLSFLSFGAGEPLEGGGGGAGLFPLGIIGIGLLPLEGGGTGGPFEEARDGGGGGASFSDEIRLVVEETAELLVPRDV